MATQPTLDPLLEPVMLGDLALANRAVMAPMTRNRADADRNPTELMATYYMQRATAGMIVSEGIPVSAIGQGYTRTSGIYNEEQVRGWRRVTEAVHANSGRIVAQLWHVGRVTHASLLPAGATPLAPSAIPLTERKLRTPLGEMDPSTPRAIDSGEVAGIIDEFREAARAALSAGFDGVEIHAANGYLIEQFLYSGTNLRSDRYGGSIANRIRFLLEIIEAVGEVFPLARTGVRLSPNCVFHGMVEEDRTGLFTHLWRELSKFDLAYLHVAEILADHRWARPGSGVGETMLPLARQTYTGTLIANGGFSLERARQLILARGADAVAFGIPYIANPDFVWRVAHQVDLAETDMATLYEGVDSDADGYTDYPIRR